MTDFEYDYQFTDEPEHQFQQSGQPTIIQMVLIIAVIVLIGVTAFLLGVMFERQTSPAGTVEMNSFWQSWEILERDFYGEVPSEADRRYGAIQGMVSAYDDPFTSYAPPQQAEQQRMHIEGRFGGIGVTISVQDILEDEVVVGQQIVVYEVMPNNPAARAGIQQGDIFVAVNDEPIQDWTTEQVAEQVRGEVGSTVALTMYRPATDKTYTVDVERAVIEFPTVSSTDLDGIGYIRINSFNDVATAQLKTQLDELMEADIQALILDLRGNGGGLLSQAVSVADLFLDAGIVLTQRSKTGDPEIYRSSNGQIAEGLPLVVLTDQGTASAAEIVAGALQDRERAILIGQQTFGKGVVQSIYTLNDGSQLRVTSAAWYTPDDRPIHEVGLAPDVILEQLMDESGNDLAVEAALTYINENYLNNEQVDTDEQ